MKDLLKLGVVFSVLVILIPALSLFGRETEPETVLDEPLHTPAQTTVQAQTEAAVPVFLAATVPQIPEILYKDEEFTVLDVDSGQVITITVEEYVIGAVMAEMPAAFHAEALKAQAVAAHTYAVRQKEKQIISPDLSLKGAYITNDSSKHQAYFTESAARAFYGERYDECYEKVSSAVEEVMDKLLYYDGEPIVAAFHSLSGGKTESAAVIWGSEIEYLVPVESEFDKYSPAYEEEKTFTAAEVKARLTADVEGISLPDDKSKWLSVKERSDSGTVTVLQAGNKELTGTRLRSLLSLRSANFTVSYDAESDRFTVTTKGYGHGVGLSQFGANEMANNGHTYDEILRHYYTGAEIISVNS